MKYIIPTLFLFFQLTLSAQNWEIIDSRSILKTNPVSYKDNIEMAGKKVAGIIHYDVDSLGMLSTEREIIYPQLSRYIGENESKWKKYRAYLTDYWKDDILPNIYINDKKLNLGKIEIIKIDGTLKFLHQASESGIQVSRTFLPSTDQRLFIEHWSLDNIGESLAAIHIGKTNSQRSSLGNGGEYLHGIKSNANEEISLLPGETYSFDLEFYAVKTGDTNHIIDGELEKRENLLNAIHDNLILRTPDPILNTLFAFSKVRAAESIFDSKMGIVHSPGGGRYYAGVWANDQAEYSGPFFPYLGLSDGNIAAINAYKKFYEQMQSIPNHDQNLWSSYEMNGDLTCCGGDRGDAAMIAFGGLHYLMALADKNLALDYLPMIEWCLEYNHKKLNPEGVVNSNSDEMEGRIATGNANLSTSALYYGALDLGINFYKEMGQPTERIEELKDRKEALEKAIEQYFGAEVEGLKTYKYFKEHKFLRHWICLPLVVGIHNRIDGTVEALFDSLWTENGVHVEKNSDNAEISKIFWDRGTLYALRGTFIAGATEKSLQRLQEFSQKRLLGDRVPYVVEAYPEGSMAHLSAESALYCRVFIEGVFGIKPLGFRSFTMTPRLPKNWNEMSLNKIQAFGTGHSIRIERVDTHLNVTITKLQSNEVLSYLVEEGDPIIVHL